VIICFVRRSATVLFAGQRVTTARELAGFVRKKREPLASWASSARNLFLAEWIGEGVEMET
jgi:hypothetical protein